MSIIKHVTLQKIVAHDFRYDPRIYTGTLGNRPLHGLTSNADSTRRSGATTAHKVELQDEFVNVLRVLSVNPLH